MATAFAMPPTEGSGPEPFRCGTCYIAFRAGDLQRAHMKGEWHRYNLKRRLADLDPIPAAVFAERISNSQAGTAKEATRAAFQGNCAVCQKTFSSPNSYQHHISSQKHKARAAKADGRETTLKTGQVDDAKSVVSSTFSLGEPNVKAGDKKGDEFDIVINRLKEQRIDDSPSVSGTDVPEAMVEDVEAGAEADEAEAPKAAAKSSEPPHSIKSCLFCNLASASVEENVTHMERDHGMFIPEKKYLVDLEGLLTYLEDQVRKYNECIYCGKPRSNVFAAQTHMRDKSHCMIPYMTVEEQVLIGDYYDFRSSYSDDEGDYDDEDVDMEGNGEDDGWETDDDESSLDSNDLTAVPADNRLLQYNRLDRNPHHSSTDPRPRHKKDGFHSRAHKPARAIYYDEHELHLPSGRAVGHRSGRRYYEQNLRHLTTPEEKIRWIRLAIESGEIDEDTGSSHISNALIASGRAGAVRSTRPDARNIRGLENISTQAARDLKKAEKRSQRRREVHSYMFKFQKPSRLGI
ncbi:pre-60s factor rei1 [Ophiostoma piceae UAMH 11346]|uniref:Pre-60s factor rei1 n=1 Tax=Ophiostoma piceae (strain UAMH 11346) TaxID=1262450 RepID=S3CHG8_OPHP1|nr:pre-60s factor rei1 [Ophiostoma piceae UAMH 11346]